MYADAQKAVKKGGDIEIGTVSICPICGHTVEGEVPEFCPICGAKGEMFKGF